MTDHEYLAWQKTHADLFNLHTADDVRLFTLWELSLKAFDFASLREASFAIATDSSDRRRWRENHLSMLREAVHGKRAEAAARERDRLDYLYERSTCSDCHGTGLVRVPHHDWVVDGDLERPFFMVVACHCLIGIGRFNAINSKLTEAETRHRLMDFSQYEALVPDWRNILAAPGERQTRELEGAELARKVDRVAPIDPTMIKKITDR